MTNKSKNHKAIKNSWFDPAGPMDPNKSMPYRHHTSRELLIHVVWLAMILIFLFIVLDRVFGELEMDVAMLNLVVGYFLVNMIVGNILIDHQLKKMGPGTVVRAQTLSQVAKGCLLGTLWPISLTILQARIDSYRQEIAAAKSIAKPESGQGPAA